MEGTKERFTVEKPWLIDQILHGGIGTYRMDHNSTFALAVVKPERNAYTMVRETNKDRNGETSKTKSNGSSYNGGGFTFWDESAIKLRSVGKDKVGESQLTRGTCCLTVCFISYFIFILKLL